MAKVIIKKLTKTYKGAKRPTLKNLNFEINEGEFLAIVGPSGCGKSTFLRMFSGLSPISSGEIYADGKLLNNVPPQKRNIAMVFQDYALYPHMSVYENMAFNLKIKGKNRKDIDRKINNAAEILGLRELLKRRPSKLSGGQRQRVALGRAMVRDPSFFLMDEPLSNLDAKLRVEMRTQIAELHQRLKTTTIYVTHDQVEAMTLADRILLLNDGIVQQIGTPNQLYNQPKNIFVAQFIGSPSMNLISGEIDDGKFKQGENLIKLPDRVPDQIKKRQGKLAIGFRPEDSRIGETSKNNSNEAMKIKAKARLIEYMGGYTLVSLDFQDQKIMVEAADNFAGTEGSDYEISVPVEKMYFFDPDSGENLNLQEDQN